MKGCAQEFRVRPPTVADAGGWAQSRCRVGRVTSRPALEASIVPFGRLQTGRNAAPVTAHGLRLRPSTCVTFGVNRMQRSAPRFRTRAA